MRVIAGTARSMPLKTVKGMDVRPTTDKTKETLFNVLQTDVPDSRFLDLFSGSGAIGIEALSRGASHAVLVEQDSKAADCILENLQFTKLIDRAELQKCDVLTALHRMEGQKPFDVIFMDPPYDQGLERQVMEYLTRSSLADQTEMQKRRPESSEASPLLQYMLYDPVSHQSGKQSRPTCSPPYLSYG